MVETFSFFCTEFMQKPELLDFIMSFCVHLLICMIEFTKVATIGYMHIEVSELPIVPEFPSLILRKCVLSMQSVFQIQTFFFLGACFFFQNNHILRPLRLTIP